MLNLTPDQRALGRTNANEVIGSTRRDFLKAAAVAPVMGAFYFGYQQMGDKPPVKAAVIGTGDEGCQAMIRFHNRDYVDYIGLCDIRPSQQARGIKEFASHKQYGPEAAAKLKTYDNVDVMLADPDVEMVVIALPLWLHAPIAIKAMQAGKHVFCEKLMAHNITQCKEMVKVAHEKNRLLAIGHQRHYSALYDNANYLVQAGHLGEIRHIRALWHRNNAVPQIEKDSNGKLVYDDKGNPVYKTDKAGNVLYFDSWKKPTPKEDENVDFAKYGYKSLEELICWRLYNRTGAGLMAELGSHQLDACSIFLGKKHPLAVTGMGGTFFYTDKREVDDHIFVNFEFPGKAENDHTIVTYSSINTNAFETYGEELMGTRGTMIVEGEKEILLYKEIDRNTWKPGDSPSGKTTTVTVENSKAGKPIIEASPSAAGPTAASSLGNLATADPSRGYREELEHFAYCIRHGNESNFHDVPDKDKPRCRGEVALADAVIALTSNMAMREKRRIEFDPKWFDWQAPEVPETGASQVARKG
jgi:predicted dehydrogenase